MEIFLRTDRNDNDCITIRNFDGIDTDYVSLCRLTDDMDFELLEDQVKIEFYLLAPNVKVLIPNSGTAWKDFWTVFFTGLTCPVAISYDVIRGDPKNVFSSGVTYEVLIAGVTKHQYMLWKLAMPSEIDLGLYQDGHNGC